MTNTSKSTFLLCILGKTTTVQLDKIWRQLHSKEIKQPALILLITNCEFHTYYIFDYFDTCTPSVSILEVEEYFLRSFSTISNEPFSRSCESLLNRANPFNLVYQFYHSLVILLKTHSISIKLFNVKITVI